MTLTSKELLVLVLAVLVTLVAWMADGISNGTAITASALALIAFAVAP